MKLCVIWILNMPTKYNLGLIHIMRCWSFLWSCTKPKMDIINSNFFKIKNYDLNFKMKCCQPIHHNFLDFKIWTTLSIKPPNGNPPFIHVYLNYMFSFSFLKTNDKTMIQIFSTKHHIEMSFHIIYISIIL